MATILRQCSTPRGRQHTIFCRSRDPYRLQPPWRRCFTMSADRSRFDDGGSRFASVGHHEIPMRPRRAAVGVTNGSCPSDRRMPGASPRYPRARSFAYLCVLATIVEKPARLVFAPLRHLAIRGLHTRRLSNGLTLKGTPPRLSRGRVAGPREFRTIGRTVNRAGSGIEGASGVGPSSC